MERFLAAAIGITVALAVAIIAVMGAGPTATDRARRNCFDAGKMWSQGVCYDH